MKLEIEECGRKKTQKWLLGRNGLQGKAWRLQSVWLIKMSERQLAYKVYWWLLETWKKKPRKRLNLTSKGGTIGKDIINIWKLKPNTQRKQIP